MSQRNVAFWRWPSAEMRRWTALVGAPVAAWFGFVYGGAWYVTSLRTDRVAVHMDWELDIPLWPAVVLVYESIFVAFAMPPFVMRTPRELQALGWTLSVVILVAGVGFLLFPAELAFAPIDADLGFWTLPVQTALLLNLATYNLAPSLHVALSVACIAMYTSYAERRGTIALWLWACAIAASTMLLHQHHVVDVVTGWTLGWLGKRLIFERWSRPLPETPHPNPNVDRASLA
jgi:membrane-associated phospholipid phosphatase